MKTLPCHLLFVILAATSCAQSARLVPHLLLDARSREKTGSDRTMLLAWPGGDEERMNGALFALLDHAYVGLVRVRGRSAVDCDHCAGTLIEAELVEGRPCAACTAIGPLSDAPRRATRVHLADWDRESELWVATESIDLDGDGRPEIEEVYRCGHRRPSGCAHSVCDEDRRALRKVGQSEPLQGSVSRRGYLPDVEDCEADSSPSRQEACAGGDAAACDHLGVLYMQGGEVAKDTGRAVDLFRKGCGGGDANACFHLGVAHLTGQGATQDPHEAVDAFRKGCDAGMPKACTNLGNLYATGQGVTKDERRAIELIRRGCDGGLATACYDLGLMYARGQGVEKDEARAVDLIRTGCNGGDATACDFLKRLAAGDRL